MSTLKVNRIEAYSGSGVQIVGLQATASNALWSGISGIPSGLVSGSYSSSMSTRITAQEDFSSSLDNTFATEAEVDAATGSLVTDITTQLGSLSIDITKGDGTIENKTIYSSSFAVKSNSVRRALSQGSGIEAFSYDGGSTQNIQLDTSSAHFTTGAKTAAGSASFSTRVSNIENKTLVSSSISGDAQGQIKVNGVNVDITSLQTTSNPTFANITGSNLTLTNNLVVNGTASFAYLQSVTGSAKIIGDAFIILNADSPAERYAGLKVYDSGSGETGSLEYDSVNDHWFYESTTEGYASGLISGPRDSRGAITWPTNNTIVKGIGSNHIDDSNITDDGSLITLGSNTFITGTLVATGTALVSGSAQVAALLPSGVVSGSALSAQTASVNTTMVPSRAYVVTGTASPITMSLPSSPSVGDLIKFANMDDRATLIARGGSNIMSVSEDLTLDIEQVSFDLVYIGEPVGWSIYGSRATS